MVHRRWNRVGGLSFVCVAVAAGAAGAQFQEPPTTPVTGNVVDARLLSPASDAPSAQVSTSVPSFACTVRTLATDASCVFHGRPTSAANEHRALREKSRAAATAVGVDLCAETLVDGPLRRQCQAAMANVSHAECVLNVASLVDDEGRFIADASECYAQLRSTLQTYRSVERVHRQCCACAAACGQGSACGALASGRAPSLAGQCQSTCAAACPLTTTSAHQVGHK